MELIESLKKILDEAVGVPQNLIPLAQKTYNDIINHLSQEYDENDLLENMSDINFEIPGPIQISDMTSDKILVTISFQKYSEYAIQRMFHAQKTEIKFPNVISHREDEIKMGIVLMYPDDGTMGGMIEYLKKQRPRALSSIAHELKHAYDFYIKGNHPVEKYVEYSASQKVGDIFHVDYLNDFIFSYYFFHEFENSVRPSEMLSYLLEVGATKETFLERFRENNIAKEIKFSTELTYDKLVQELENNYGVIYNILKINNFNPTKDKSQIIQLFLFVVRKIMIGERVGVMKDVMPDMGMAGLFLSSMGVRTVYDDFLEKFFDKLTSGGKYYENQYDETKSPEINRSFFEKSINSIKQLAGKTLRKVSKVYSELPSEKDGTMTLNKKISSKK